jgi:hypothetical protein
VILIIVAVKRGVSGFIGHQASVVCQFPIVSVS